MANMCENSIVFTGNPAAVENVKALFKEIEEKQNETGKWHLPPYVTANFSHMQDISIDQEKINYETRWYPNFEGLIQIADHYQLDFVNNYNELANGLFGEATYKNSVFNDIRLEPEDFQAYQYDKEIGLFVYDGKNYSFEWPIFEKLLERRKENELYLKIKSNDTGSQISPKLSR
jgi:Ferredoxin-like domain in Api92-like protein